MGIKFEQERRFFPKLAHSSEVERGIVAHVAGSRVGTIHALYLDPLGSNAVKISRGIRENDTYRDIARYYIEIK